MKKACSWYCVFLCSQDAQDAYLEQQREVALTQKVQIIQKSIRMWAVRRRFLKMRGSCMMIQSRWRGYSARKKFLAVSFSYFIFVFQLKKREETCRRKVGIIKIKGEKKIQK